MIPLVLTPPGTPMRVPRRRGVRGRRGDTRAGRRHRPAGRDRADGARRCRGQRSCPTRSPRPLGPSGAATVPLTPRLRRDVGLVWRGRRRSRRRARAFLALSRDGRSYPADPCVLPTLGLMVIGLAFLATAVATLFAQATLVRFTKDHRPQDLAWTISLAMFALASAALATGVSTGWDNGTVPHLLPARRGAHRALARARDRLPPRGRERGRKVQWGLVFFSGLATGVLLTAPIDGQITAPRSRSAARSSASSRACSPRSAAGSARS